MRGESGWHPQAGVDYPGTWAAFLKWFPDDPSCVVFLERLRWPDGFGVRYAGGGGLADCRRQLLLPLMRPQGFGHVRDHL